MLEKAIALAQQGKKEEARELLQQIVAHNPKNQLAWLWLADCAPSLDGRRRYVERALEADPQNEKVRRVLERMKSTESAATKPSPPDHVEVTKSSEPVEYQEITKGALSIPRPLLLIPIIAISIVLGIVGYNALQSMQQRVEKIACDKQAYLNQTGLILSEWQDLVEIAEGTPRMALGGQVERLQDIWKETKNQEVPSCAEMAHAELVEYMDLTIEGFVAFLGQQDDDYVSNKFTLARKRFDAWEDATKNIGN